MVPTCGQNCKFGWPCCGQTNLKNGAAMHRRQLPQQLIRRLAQRDGASSAVAGRRHGDPTAPSAAASRHRRRMATSAASARGPQQYVAGLTPEQLDANEDLQRWFAAN